MTDDVLFLSGAQVTRLPDVEAAIAFTALSSGAADPPAKITHPSRCDDGVAFAHVSRLTAGSGPSRSPAASIRPTRRPDCPPSTPW